MRLRLHILVGLRVMLVLTVVTGILYPLVVTTAARVAFPEKADGSLVRRDGKVVGSKLIGQDFTAAKYFRPRPSAAGSDGYDAGASSGSNLGPSNDALLAAVTERVAAYRDANGLRPGALVPVDAVTASGSGLDPHISVANARLQAGRVARERNADVQSVLRLVDRSTERRSLGIFGEDGVNVLQLNLALDRATAP